MRRTVHTHGLNGEIVQKHLSSIHLKLEVRHGYVSKLRINPDIINERIHTETQHLGSETLSPPKHMNPLIHGRITRVFKMSPGGICRLIDLEI